MLRHFIIHATKLFNFRTTEAFLGTFAKLGKATTKGCW